MPVLSAHTFQMRCDKQWLQWLDAAAGRVRLSKAAYIRQVVTQRMIADKIPAPKAAAKNGR